MQRIRQMDHWSAMQCWDVQVLKNYFVKVSFSSIGQWYSSGWGRGCVVLFQQDKHQVCIFPYIHARDTSGHISIYIREEVWPNDHNPFWRPCTPAFRVVQRRLLAKVWTGVFKYNRKQEFIATDFILINMSVDLKNQLGSVFCPSTLSASLPPSLPFTHFPSLSNASLAQSATAFIPSFSTISLSLFLHLHVSFLLVSA